MRLPIVTTQRARKEHPCDAKRGCMIEPGQTYHREVWPPWAVVRDDPEPPWSTLGHWEVRRAHPGCEADLLYGGTNLLDAP